MGLIWYLGFIWDLLNIFVICGICGIYFEIFRSIWGHLGFVEIIWELFGIFGNYFRRIFCFAGVSPSLADHDHNCTLPNPYPAHWDNMTSHEQFMFEEHEKWRCFIGQDRLNNTAVGR